MTTTARDDPFVTPTQTIERIRAPYDTVAILRQNVAALELALKQQTERAIQAERDFESFIADDNTIQEYAYELGGTDSGEYHLTSQDIARIAAKASDPHASALRSIASYVGAGGYNSVTVDAGVFEEKIRWGIGEIQDRLAGAIERELAARTALIEARNDIQTWIDSRNEWMARAEAAETELAKLREQKPVAWMDAEGDTYKDEPTENWCPPHVPLYASFAHAVHKGATHCDDCGLTWLDDGLNPLRCPYCKDAVPAPAVPTDEQIHVVYRNALGQSIRERDMPEIRKFAHALLQSARGAQ